jgi:putative hydroxymethylpyrimidine transport system permease protein
MFAAALLVALVGAWELYVRLADVEPLILPPPSDVAVALWEDRDVLAPDLAITAMEATFGLLAAAIVGVVIAVAMHQSATTRRALYPLVVGSQAVPIVVLAAPLLVVLGFGLAPKIVIVALVCFFPITVTLYDGLRAVDPDQRKLLRSLGASRWRTLFLLEARAAAPQALTGLRLAAAVSVIGAVFAEYSGSEGGLGRLVLISQGQLETPRMFAATFLLFVLALALYGLFALAERRLITWKR